MNKENYTKWLEKAEEDEIAGKTLLQEGHIPAGPICFHFQQMAEKLLKALLVFHQQDFPKIHDLITLAALCKPFAAEIDECQQEVEILNRFYTETRYPGDYPEFSQKEAAEAFKAALQIKDFVLSKIK